MSLPEDGPAALLAVLEVAPSDHPNKGHAGRPLGVTSRTKRRQPRIPENKQWDRDLLLYLAGFLDGEGSIFMTASSDGLHANLMVNIHNTDLPVLRWIQTAIGAGYVYDKGENRPGRRPVYFYNISGRNAVRLLEALCPYMRIKRTQAELAILAYSGDQSTRLAAREQLTQLNRGGVRLRAR